MTIHHTSAFIRILTLSVFAILSVFAPMHFADAKGPASVNWLRTATHGQYNSYILGNPAAATTITEYASYTCTHCAHFEATSTPAIKKSYIASGKVKLEVRNLLRDNLDMTIAVLVRCGGSGKFFGNHSFFMNTQNIWTAKASKLPTSPYKQLKPQERLGYMLETYKFLGLSKLMAKRGFSDAQSRACLSDKSSMNAVIGMTDFATGPMGLNSTPSFFVNDQYKPDSYDLETLKPFLPAI